MLTRQGQSLHHCRQRILRRPSKRRQSSNNNHPEVTNWTLNQDSRIGEKNLYETRCQASVGEPCGENPFRKGSRCEATFSFALSRLPVGVIHADDAGMTSRLEESLPR